MHKRSNNSNNKNKKEETFEITQDKIDVIKKAAQYIKQMDDFCGFVNNNFFDAEKISSIMVKKHYSYKKISL
jgi:hypothetical protein